jgi:hypothetical protein
MGSTTRLGSLARVFDNGTSPLLNHIARLSVLYEDLRIEIASLLPENQPSDGNPLDFSYRHVYFLRRSLATLMEFQSGLTQIAGLPEFKQSAPRLSKLDSRYINAANRYFQKHNLRIKELRNELGGHIQQDAVDYALSNFPSDLVGSVTWSEKSGIEPPHFGLELHFAGAVVGGAVQSTLQSSANVEQEMKGALEITIGSYVHVYGATAALVHAFLWDKFGK